MNSQFEGYHTCKCEGGPGHVTKSAPFLSKEHGSPRLQWLTQGYYMWTDLEKNAHDWGRIAYNNKYAIVKCDIDIDKNLVLDIVGNAADIDRFDRFFKEFTEVLKNHNGEDSGSVTVSAIIDFYRKLEDKNNGSFPYHAIKAADVTKYNNIRFVSSRREVVAYSKRQQLCLFEGRLSAIKKKELIYISDYE